MTKIHVGCGKRNFGPEWIHIDGAEFPHVTSSDFRLCGYEVDSVDLIYACHFIEYFDRDEVAALLLQWYERMKPGATLRLAVPDFENMVLAIRHYDFKLDDILGPLYGKMGMGDKTIYHRTVYDYTSLKNLLYKTGFKLVRRYDWRKTEHSAFDDHSQAYLPKMDKDNGILISLNVEAMK